MFSRRPGCLSPPTLPLPLSLSPSSSSRSHNIARTPLASVFTSIATRPCQSITRLDARSDSARRTAARGTVHAVSRPRTTKSEEAGVRGRARRGEKKVESRGWKAVEVRVVVARCVCSCSPVHNSVRRGYRLELRVDSGAIERAATATRGKQLASFALLARSDSVLGGGAAMDDDPHTDSHSHADDTPAPPAHPQQPLAAIPEHSRQVAPVPVAGGHRYARSTAAHAHTLPQTTLGKPTPPRARAIRHSGPLPPSSALAVVRGTVFSRAPGHGRGWTDTATARSLEAAQEPSQVLPEADTGRSPFSHVCSEHQQPTASSSSADPPTQATAAPVTPGQQQPQGTPLSPASEARMDDSEATAAATALANLAPVAAASSSSASTSAPAVPAPVHASADGERPPGSFDPAAPNAVNGLPNPLPANYDKVRVFLCASDLSSQRVPDGSLLVVQTQPICANCATQVSSR